MSTDHADESRDRRATRSDATSMRGIVRTEGHSSAPRRSSVSTTLHRLPFFAVLLALTGCMYPDRDVRREPSSAWTTPETTHLGRLSRDVQAQHPELSGVYVLGPGLDAFAARALLCARAEQTLDVQYYILHDDVTGRFLLGRMLEAADRGVRVRLLLDDLGTSGIDPLLAALDAHPRLEVRLFNPFARGWSPGLARALDMLRRPRRLNHRMHNKMLAADGAAAIVGGRNLGDEYFDAHPGVNFADLDLLAAGPVLRDLGTCFDRYWNSEFAVPVAAWRAMRARESDLLALRSELAAHATTQQASPYAARLATARFVEEALGGELALLWGNVQAVADAPEKVTAKGEELERALLTSRLRHVVTNARSELTIVSPYFVPGDTGVELLRELRGRGVRVRILTNAFAATDVGAVHAGYSSYRRALLRAGVELYELRATSTAVDAAHARGAIGSSGASLHAKTFCVDGRSVFIGSLNLDPRSIDLNTELGLVVESEELARQVLDDFERGTQPDVSWRVSLEGEGNDTRLVWVGERDGVLVRLTREPDFSFWNRMWIGFLKLLPIESQL
ncbi:MAG: phospholipase D family protein [Planctomycetota bacterium]